MSEVPPCSLVISPNPHLWTLRALIEYRLRALVDHAVAACEVFPSSLPGQYYHHLSPGVVLRPPHPRGRLVTCRIPGSTQSMA